MLSQSQTTSAASRVAVIAITAVLYAVAKGATAYISSPFGVGQLLVGIFVPAFLAVTADTVSVAVGAGLGTFIGDTFFLAPAGSTNPALSLIAGVPSNFIAFLLFGWFVKRYKSWPAFVAATLSFVTLGNLIAAVSVVFFGAAVFTPLVGLVHSYNLGSLVLGFTVFWNATSIPAVLIGVPLLVRAVRPLQGRSSVLKFYPSWTIKWTRGQILAAAVLGAVFLAMGVTFFVAVPKALVPAVFNDVEIYLIVALATLVVVGPIAGIIAGSRKPTS